MAMQDALRALKSGRMPPPADLPSFADIKKVVGFEGYYEDQSRYSTSSSPKYDIKQEMQFKEIGADMSLEPSPIGVSSLSQTDERPASQGPEVDLVIPYVLEESKDEHFSGSSSKIWSCTLRVKKVTANNGVVKLDVRIPVMHTKFPWFSYVRCIKY
ncbi:hypothetical protein GOP47_0017162 [Adiantum capillus-veneris]|uniref:Uncharacterized protein n=1 Tax=Adiantum capillus-veneris TaxID=13818 RepID=A0A9D4UJS6_ADICA|nr:hypothetical protein GOP47_0017162 [Adiantum capillus-veneris]